MTTNRATVTKAETWSHALQSKVKLQLWKKAAYYKGSCCLQNTLPTTNNNDNSDDDRTIMIATEYWVLIIG